MRDVKGELRRKFERMSRRVEEVEGDVWVREDVKWSALRSEWGEVLMKWYVGMVWISFSLGCGWRLIFGW